MEPRKEIMVAAGVRRKCANQCAVSCFRYSRTMSVLAYSNRALVGHVDIATTVIYTDAGGVEERRLLNECSLNITQPIVAGPFIASHR